MPSPVTDFIRLKQEGFVPDRDIILALTADEEGGTSNGVDWLLEESSRADRCGIRPRIRTPAAWSRSTASR